MKYLWPQFVGGPRHGEPITLGELRERAWIHVPKSTGGMEMYWPMQIMLDRGDEADRLVVYVHTDENRNEVAGRIMGELARAAGCEAIP